MKHSDYSSLPPCVLSTHCQRLLDDLTSSDTQRAIDQIFTNSSKDRQDERLIEQIRDHLPHCPTCSATLAQASRVRAEQRAILHRYLNQSQAIVPSTTARIFEAAQEEQQKASPASSPPISRKRLEYMLPELLVSPPESNHNGHHHSATDPLTLSPVRRWVSNGLSLATVAALLFVAVGIFGHFIFRSTGTLAGPHTPVTGQHLPTKISGSAAALSSPTTETASPGSTPASDAFQGWNGLVLITGIGAMYNVISTYNYLNGDHRTLAQSDTDIQFDGVGSHGQDMLYQVVTSGHTLYYTLHLLPTTGFFYELDQDNALNAIWMPDNIHVLVATVYDGVVEVNTQTGQSQPYLPKLKTQALKFYREGYLYFLGGPDRAADTLFRINVTTGVVQQVTFRSMGGDFWLSPDGSTVYFKAAGPVGPSGIYAVNSDGTEGGVLRPDGTPIGYAPDDSLVIMRQVNQTFEVVDLGATPEQDQVLLRDAAPGASSLCDLSFVAQTICDTTNIALAPLSHALVVIASYPDGSRKVWSDDLTTGKRIVMMTPTSDTSVMVPGWDRIAVA